MKVIGAGTGRTGTRSLKEALEILGLGPCYHMVELLQNPERVTHWEAAERGDPVDWDACFAGYQSAVDLPTYRHYKTLMNVYPGAKVILTERDPEDWWESANATIYRAEPGLGRKILMSFRMPFSRRLRDQVRCFKLAGGVWKKDFAGRFEDKAYATGVFARNNEEVKATVPPGRLLVYRVQEGWGPLCAFLGVPEPAVPFPRLNDRAEFEEQKRKMLA